MDRVIFKKDRVAEARPRRAPEACESDTTIHLVREGDVVRALEVRCSCGDLITVELDYASDDPAARA